jgi:hypothetical protein
MVKVKPHDRLVRLSFTRYRASTCRLSTSSSSTGLWDVAIRETVSTATPAGTFLGSLGSLSSRALGALLITSRLRAAPFVPRGVLERQPTHPFVLRKYRNFTSKCAIPESSAELLLPGPSKKRGYSGSMLNYSSYVLDTRACLKHINLFTVPGQSY